MHPSWVHASFSLLPSESSFFPAKMARGLFLKHTVPKLKNMLATTWSKGKTFFCKNFWTPQPGKIPRISRRQSSFSLTNFQQREWTSCWPPTPSCGRTPIPPGGLWTQAVHLCARFSCLILLDSHNQALDSHIWAWVCNLPTGVRMESINHPFCYPSLWHPSKQSEPKDPPS